MICFVLRKRRFDVVTNALLANELLQALSTLAQLARMPFQDFAGNVRCLERAAHPCFHLVVRRLCSTPRFG